MYYYVYVLKSLATEENTSIYIGYTADLRKRFSQHNNGESLATKRRRPWELIYYEAYKNKEDAVRRERMLKYDGRGKALLKKRLLVSLS